MNLLVIIDGLPGSGKKDTLKILARLMPDAKCVFDVDPPPYIAEDGILSAKNPCCYNLIQRYYTSRRCRRDMKRKSEGLTVQIRDIFSCRAFQAPHRLHVATSSGWDSLRAINKECPQDQAEEVVWAKLRKENVKRLNILLRPSLSSRALLRSHPENRRRELRSKASQFITLLDKCQRHHGNFKAILSGSPRSMALAIKKIILDEYQKV